MLVCLNIIKHGLNDGIFDHKIKTGKYSLFMPSEHPGKVFQGSGFAVSYPKEPTIEMFRCHALPLVGRQLEEEFLERVSFDDLLVHLEKIAEYESLLDG